VISRCHFIFKFGNGSGIYLDHCVNSTYMLIAMFCYKLLLWWSLKQSCCGSRGISKTVFMVDIRSLGLTIGVFTNYTGCRQCVFFMMHKSMYLLNLVKFEFLQVINVYSF